MYTKSILVSALIASVSLSGVAAAQTSEAGAVQKRCAIGSCGTTSNSNSSQSSNASISNNETVSNQQATTGSGNQITKGNNGGGNSFGDAHVGKVCGRAFFEAKKRQIDDHVSMVTRNMDFSRYTGNFK
ncbi:hypothetical protein K437DRAFT_296942, partial [Tilletiaria anomala UBC 951]